MNRIYIFYVLFLICNFGYTQIWNNPLYQQKKIKEDSIIRIDSTTLLPQQNTNAFSNFKINTKRNSLVFKTPDSTKVHMFNYYKYPFPLFNTFSLRDTLAILKKLPVSVYSSFKKNKKNNSLDLSALNITGSFLRGVQAGSLQDASVQSNFDIQIDGKLAKNLFIRGKINDNNIPIQSDGYTQQFSDFDELFIEMYNDNFKVRSGHIYTNQLNDYFNPFKRKLNGLKTSYTHKSSKDTLNVQATFASSRGQFSRTFLKIQEGNQGPYILNIAQQTQRVTVISGSERVYLNGILLQRGEENDYVIRYNLGEITFTSKRLVSATDQIQVDFEYSNQAYNKFNIQSSINYNSKKLKGNFNFYSDSDNQNNPLNINLSDTAIQQLQNAGDNPDLLVYDAVVLADYNPLKIQYNRIESNGITYYERALNNALPVYEVTFTNVGINQGNYRETNFEANGRIFEYVPPINGIKQGNYSPNIRLIPPEKLLIYSTNGSYTLVQNHSLLWNAALSNFDQNKFSNLDNNNNIGLAYKLGYQAKIKRENWEWIPTFYYENLDKKYQSAEPLNNLSFIREFNLNPNLKYDFRKRLSSNQFFKINNHQLEFNTDYLKTDYSYNGLLNKLNYLYENKSFRTKLNTNLLNAESNFQETKSIKTEGLLEKTNKKMNYGIRLKYDYLNDKKIDNPLNLSNQLLEPRLFYGFKTENKAQFRAELYHQKIDSITTANKIENYSKTNGLLLNQQWKINQYTNLDLNLDLKQIDFRTQDKQNLFIGNLKFNTFLFQKALQLKADYTIGTGREPQRSFSYLKVDDGLGIYTWIDYNENDLQELNEFEVALYQDQANYIRVYNNSTNFLPSSINELKQFAHFKPKNLLENKNHFLGKFEYRFTYNTQLKTLKSNKEILWFPITSDQTISHLQNLKSIIYFNRNSTKFSADYQYKSIVNQFQLTTGNDAKKIKEHQLNLRWYLSSLIWMNQSASYLENNRISTGFQNQNYALKIHQFHPSFEFKTDDSNWLVEIGYQWQQKQNTLGNEFLKSHLFEGNLEYNLTSSRMQIQSNLKFINHLYIGQQNTTISYQMLEGIQPGKNYIWQLNLRKKIGKILELNLMYQGRKSKNNTVIHNGNVQLRAQF